MNRYLTAEIYRDAATPDLSIDPALSGLEIIRDIAPWIRIQKENGIALSGLPEGPIDVDEVPWPKVDADLTIVLTQRKLLGVQAVDHQRSQAVDLDFLGVTMTWLKPKFRQVIVVDTSSIKRPEHIVAHEIGHAFGIDNATTESSDMHCQDKKCLMYSLQYRYGRADRSFCECCSEQLHVNSQALRRTKVRQLALGTVKKFL